MLALVLLLAAGWSTVTVQAGPRAQRSRSAGDQAAQAPASALKLTWQPPPERALEVRVPGSAPGSAAEPRPLCASRQQEPDPDIDPGMVAPAPRGLDDAIARPPDCRLR